MENEYMLVSYCYRQTLTHPTSPYIAVDLWKVLQLIQNILVSDVCYQGPKWLQLTKHNVSISYIH